MPLVILASKPYNSIMSSQKEGQIPQQPQEKTRTFDEYRSMLNPVYKAFTSVFNDNIKVFNQQDFEPLIRERWEGLDVELRWHGSDNINRRIQAEIDYEGFKASPQRLELPVTAVAYKTKTGLPYGKSAKAKVEEVARFALPLDESDARQIQELQDTIRKAFSHVSTWTENDLKPVEPREG